MEYRKHVILKNGMTLAIFILFLISTPPARAECVSSCPSGQTATGNCQLDPGCDSSIGSCQQGVFCSASATPQRQRSQSASAGGSLPKLKTFCFQKGECEAPPYQGEAKEAPECGLQDARYVQAGYLYNCYAKQKPIALEVSIGGYKVAGIEDYIRKLYTYFISISGIVVGVMYTWAGVKWITSAGAPEKISDAKHKIGNATIGLVLLLSSYVILQTVNPALVRLRLPAIKMPRQVLLGDDVCVNRPEYPCGGTILRAPLAQDPFGRYYSPNVDPTERSDFHIRDGRYQCDDPQNPNLATNPPCQDGVGSGACMPRFCPFPGCYTLLENRVTDTAKRRLMYLAGGSPSLEDFQEAGIPAASGARPEEALRDLQEFLEAVSGSQRLCIKPEECSGCPATTKLATCISSACNCVLELDGDDKLICAPARATGQPCDRDAQCGAGGVCNLATDVCGPSDPGSDCSRDQECVSGLCNENSGPNACVAPGSLRIGQDCSASEECVTGICGYEGLIGAGVNAIGISYDPVCVAETNTPLAPCELTPIVGCNTNSGD